MKKVNLFLFGVIIVLITFSSCSINKKVYLSGYNVNWESANNKNSKSQLADKKKPDISRSEKNISDANDLIASTENQPDVKNTIEQLYKELAIEYARHKQSVYISTDSCDTIFLKNGSRIIAKEIELSSSVVSYKNCDSLPEILYAIKASDISIIKYTNGSQDVFNYETTVTSAFVSGTENSTKTTKRHVDGIGLTAFILCFLGLIIAGIPLGIASIVLGIISKSKTNRHPEKFVGRGFSTTAIILGFIDIIGGLIFLSMI